MDRPAPPRPRRARRDPPPGRARPRCTRPVARLRWRWARSSRSRQPRPPTVTRSSSALAVPVRASRRFESPQQHRQVLAWLKRPHRQNVGTREPIAGPHTRDILRRRWTATGMRRARQHHDAAIRDPQHGGEITARRLRHRAYARGGPGDDRQQRADQDPLAGVEELGRPDERQIVDDVQVGTGASRGAR